MYSYNERSGGRSMSRRSSMSGSIMNLAGPEKRMNRCCNKTTRGTLLIVCLLLVTTALVCTAISLINTSWLTLDITEYQQNWQIGLWRYCRWGGGPNEVGAPGTGEWVCDVKDLIPTINPNTGMLDSQFKLNDHNETPVLFLLISAFLLGLVSWCALCCAYCNKYIPYCIIVINVLAMSCSIAAFGLYTFSLQSIDSRRYTSFNQVYIGEFGIAYYCAGLAMLAFIVSFILTIPITILSFAWGRYKTEKYRAESMIDIDPSRKNLIGDPYDNRPIIIERDPETRSISNIRRLDDMDEDLRSAIVETLSRHGSMTSLNRNGGGAPERPARATIVTAANMRTESRM